MVRKSGKRNTTRWEEGNEGEEGEMEIWKTEKVKVERKTQPENIKLRTGREEEILKKRRNRIRRRKRRRWKQQSLGRRRNYHRLNVPNCPSSHRREIGGDAPDALARRR